MVYLALPPVATPDRPRVAVVEGIRTPFAKAGTALAYVPPQELGRVAARECLDRSGFDPAGLDEVIFGCAGQPSDAANIGRVVALNAGVPQAVPACTVHRNCASAMEAVTTAMDRIAAGRGETLLAGGTESMSSFPLNFPRSFADKLGRAAAARSLGARLAAFASMRPRDFKPRIAILEGLTDPFTGMNMGETAEKLAREFGLGREAQDRFALESHRRAVAAAPRLAEEMVPVAVPPRYERMVAADVGPREGQTMEALAKLKPLFGREHGTVTAGNACMVTDGAVALLLMREDRARAEGRRPLGYLVDYAYAGLEPERMGLGPVYAMHRLLGRQGLSLADLDLVELNEAFAAQVMACQAAMASEAWCREHLGRGALGELDPARLNPNGGAIALGHPVGATGARIILTLLKELGRRGLQRGVATLCIGGGQGGAVLVERA